MPLEDCLDSVRRQIQTSPTGAESTLLALKASLALVFPNMQLR